MGASSSGLLDETKISHIKGLVDSAFQSFSAFYRQQYAAAYFCHLHHEVEPKKEGKALLLTHRSQYPPDDVLYQGSVKFSCWDEHGKKCREKCIILRRNYKVEIHENMETFNRGCAAKLVLQPVGGSVLTTEEESRLYLEQTCAGILNGVKEDSSLVASFPDAFAVYLHLPYTGHTCFLFKEEEERDHFLSALKTCIRHQNLDPWCKPSYETQAYIRALQLYLQDKGPYESWERLLGTEEQVLASEVMEGVLPWLQSQLQSRLKGKKAERMRQWFATVQATYTLVLEQLSASLEALREECRQAASANQALIRSNLDQILSSHNFLEQKVRGVIYEEAEKECSESVAPYLSSILDVLTENISAGIQEMQKTFHTHIDSAFTCTNGATKETDKGSSTLGSINLEQCYKQVLSLQEKLGGLKERFGLSSTEKLVHSAHLEMEQLLDSAVYTLELFLQSSAKLQPSQTPVNMERAKGRVLKQLDYDSRVVQRRVYQEALLEITLPALTRKMDSKWRNELQQFEQYIFSDYSSFVLVRNVYDEILRNLLSKVIETVLQDAVSSKSNTLLLDTSDLAISQYSLLGQTPPRSAPDSPAVQARDSSAAEKKESTPDAEKEDPTVPLAERDPGTSSPQSTDVPVECAPPAALDLILDKDCSNQPPPAFTDDPIKMSLGSLSEALGSSATGPSVQQNTDRAVYLTGEMKDVWEAERVKEEKQTAAAEETTGENNEKANESERRNNEEAAAEGRTEESEERGSETGERNDEVAEEKTDESEEKGSETEGRNDEVEEKTDESEDRVSETQKANDEVEEEITEQSEEKGSKTETRHDEEEDENADKSEDKGSQAERRNNEEETKENKENEEEVEQEAPQSSLTLSAEPQPEGSAEPPLGSVALIRELVTTEVEVDISPRTYDSDTP